jgi:hypothetical protein
MGYELDGQGSILGRAKIFLFSTASRLSLLSNWYQGFFPWGKSSRGMKLIIQLYLVPRSRMVELYVHPPNMSSWCGA